MKFRQSPQHGRQIVIWKFNRKAVTLGLALLQQASRFGGTHGYFSAGVTGW